MTTIEKIEAKLRKYPDLRYSKDGATITVESPTDDGFSVWLTEGKAGYTVGFDGWHDEFSEEEEALSAFAFGLSDDCRLKVIRRGDTACAWSVEGRGGDGQWREDSTTGLLITPFWKKRTVVYRRNHIMNNSEQDAGHPPTRPES